MATLEDILGGGLPAGLLSPEQEALAQQRAQNAGLLNLAFGLIQGSQGQPGQGRPSLGQIIGKAGPVGVQAYQQSFENTLQNALRGMQIQEMKRRQAEQEQINQARQRYTQRMQELSGGVITPSMALAGGQGPTPAAAATLGQPIPDMGRQQQAAAMELLGQAAPEALAAQMLKPPELPKYMAVEGNVFRVTPQGLVKEAEVPKAPLVQINEGEKGFKNEIDLKNQFKSEPVYKAYQEMQSAYGQITESLKKGTPAGDLAGATKFMKLLDPGSVVRESELYLAMSATGALDRFMNYANTVIKGTKLTPSQRADFQSLADKLFTDSVSAFNAKRGEYFDLGSAYGLNAERALGAPAKVPSAAQLQTGSLADRINEEMKRRGMR